MPIGENPALLRALDELAPLVRQQAALAERDAALSAAVVGPMLRHGLLRLWIPRRHGGFEMDLPSTLQLHQAAARIDGSFGWAVMIGAGGGLFAAFLEETAAGRLFGPQPAVVAGSGTADGRAERVPGGYRVQGQWRYASGAPWATLFTANCIVTRDGEAEIDARGNPLVRAMAFAADEVQVLPTWDPVGMRGTASHDFRVDGVFVPEAHSFSLDVPPREPGPLYRLPFEVLTELPLFAVALGIMRHVLDAFAALTAGGAVAAGAATRAGDPLVQAAHARAHATWQLARAGLEAAARQAWSCVTSGQALPPQQRADITATSVHGVASLRTAADELAALCGMSAIRRTGELGRALRDLQALAAHFSVSPRRLAAAGAVLLKDAARTGAPGRS